MSDGRDAPGTVKWLLWTWNAICGSIVVFVFFAAPAWDLEADGYELFSVSGADVFVGVALVTGLAWLLGLAILAGLGALLTRALQLRRRSGPTVRRDPSGPGGAA